MTIPVTDVKGIGPKTAQYLQAYGITTAEALVEAGVASLMQAPGFNEARAMAVIKVAADMIGEGKKSGKKKKDKGKKNKSRKEKGKKGKDKKGRKKDRKKDKKSKKHKKNKKDKGKGKK